MTRRRLCPSKPFAHLEVAVLSPAGNGPSLHETIRRMASGFVEARLLYTVAALGIADLIEDGPQSVSVLAQRARVDERSLYRILRALASVGIFTETSRLCFGQTGLSDLLRSDHPSSCRWHVMETAGPMRWEVWKHLPDSVATGRTGMEFAFGTSLWDYLNERPEERSLYYRA